MKRIEIGLVVIFIMLLMTACNSGNDKVTVKQGSYIMVQSEKEEVFSPRLNIKEDTIVFSHDLLSSYLAIGTYTIEDDVLTMKTDDDLYHYVFRIDGDKLIFQKDESSSVKLIDDRLGVKITDGAVFQLEEASDETTEPKNDIFTEEVYGQLKEIDYWYGDTKLVINNETDMRSFYDNLASLQLKVPELTDAQKVGHQIIDLVLEDETISIGLLAGEININGKRYYTDKDICDAVRTIALKYENYYNNNVFTEDLFEQLIEIDCWVEGEKLIIDDAERLEEVYHYLSRLTLEKASSDYELITEPMQIDLITEDTTISFSATSKVICIDDIKYYTDSNRDMVQLITSIAKENQ